LLKVEELNNKTEIRSCNLFDLLIERRWGTSMNPPPETTPNDRDPYDEYEDDDEKARSLPEMEETVDATGTLIDQQPAYDKIINAEVQLHHRDHIITGKVKRRALGPDGKTACSYHDNLMLNSTIYEVEFPGGEVKEYAANVIAENMLTQVDYEGFTTTMIEGIINHDRDENTAVHIKDKYVKIYSNQRRLQKSTAGWKLQILWKDKSESWVHLKDIKESHPIEVAEYARACGIDNEPAFAWWVPYTLRKRDIILSSVKARIRKTTHKYRIEIPTSLPHASEIDAEHSNTFWRDVIRKEITNIGIAFEILENDMKTPAGWNMVTGHIIFDVKMDFTRKARWVLDGHKTPDPVGSTYAGVVSRESVRIAFTYAALNNLDVWAADIQNAYLQAPSSQKHYIVCGAEFGLENVGK